MFNLIGRAIALDDRSFITLPIAKGDVGIRSIIARGIDGFLMIAGAIAVIYLVYGGILYMTAGGNSEQATKGKTAIINAIIGITIIFVAFIIVRTVGTILEKGKL